MRARDKSLSIVTYLTMCGAMRCDMLIMHLHAPARTRMHKRRGVLRNDWARDAVNFTRELAIRR